MLHVLKRFYIKAVDPYQEYKEIESIASQFGNQETDYVACAAMSIYDLDRLVWPKGLFETTTLLEFEGFKFPAPLGYDEVLKITYGDYNQLPPIEKRGGHNMLAYENDSFVYDMDKPYSEYIGKGDNND